SDRQVRAISDAIAEALREAGDKPLGIEGYEDGSWILIDANDVIVHVFRGDTRKHYDLERLWSDAPVIPVAGADEAAAAGDGSEQVAP
ncbi:MAG: ribosome silencing factor, partial [Myxococcales bacterium]|nr:ribosome silencing factor [Myxococcales bacterium]